jgi:hypothetical protein
VRVGVVARAAVRVGRVAVVLDLGGRVGAADVAARAGGELKDLCQCPVSSMDGGNLHLEQSRCPRYRRDPRRNAASPSG